MKKGGEEVLSIRFCIVSNVITNIRPIANCLCLNYPNNVNNSHNLTFDKDNSVEFLPFLIKHSGKIIISSKSTLFSFPNHL